MIRFFNYFSLFVTWYILILNTIYVVLLLISLIGIIVYIRNKIAGRIVEVIASDLAPPVSLLVPAYNEQETIVKAVKSFLQIEYPEFEVVVINDGSKDDTLEKLKNEFNLYIVDRKFRKLIDSKDVIGIYYSKRYDNLIVVDKINGGKADALNCGINVCSYPYICTLDADSILERDSIAKVMQPFFDEPDKVVAVSGIVRIVNGSMLDNFGKVQELHVPKSNIARFQIIEYFRAFLAARKGLSMIGSLLIASGAFAGFKKEDIIMADGFNTKTVGEDMEIVVRLKKIAYEKKKKSKVIFVPDPIVWTQCPEKLGDLAKQRKRWQRGLAQVVFQHRSLFFNPRYGMLGLFGYPYQVIFELLGPVIELIGYIIVPISYIFGIININVALFFLAVEVLYGIAISILSVLFSELSEKKYNGWKDFIILVIIAVVENLGYRQLTVLWRVMGIYEAVVRKQGWAKAERKKL
ncbi:glycosyltransferase [Caldicellulosiruptoraceae bacterium PP1]